jgi:hypothetical protein
MSDHKPLVAEETLERIIEAVPAREFTVIDFIAALRKGSPKDLELLLKKYGELGEDRNSQYTIKHYLAQKLMRHSWKEHSLLQRFTPWHIDKKKDFRETTQEERLSHGSPLIAVFRKR